MDKKKSFLTYVMIFSMCAVGCMMLGGVISVCGVYAQETIGHSDIAADDVIFSADDGKLYFFSPTEKIVYVYSSQGDFREAFVVNAWGERLESRSRSELRRAKEKANMLANNRGN